MPNKPTRRVYIYLPSGTIWTVDYTPSGSSFGTEILTFKAQDITGLFSDSVTVTNVTILYDDSISLNEPSTKSVIYGRIDRFNL